MINDYIHGFSLVLTFGNIIAIIIGTLFGVIMAAIPGLTGTMGMALIIPLTYTMSPITAFCILIGTFKGCLFGGSIPAILINTPGTPAAAVTVFDGFPMARNGQAGKAMGIALFASVVADAFATIVLIFFAVLLAKVALKFGPPEFAALITFSLCIVAGVSGESMIKGILAATIGFLLATIGLDPMVSTPRFTFNSVHLFEGISMMALLIGLFAISEVLSQAEADDGEQKFIPDFKGTISFQDIKKCMPVIMKGSLIGIILGAIPGLGAVPAAFLSYAEARRSSKHPEKFGKGAIEGVAAAEAGNNATCGGSLIPLLALGVPGDVTAAVLLGAFMIHGLTPGPALFTEHAEFVYALFAALLVSIFFLPLIGRVCISLFGFITKLKKTVLFPATVILCSLGTYGFSSSHFDIWVMVLFGVIGWIMRKYAFPLAPLLIGYILEPIGEVAIRQSLTLSNGNPIIFISRPISLFFLILTAISITSLVVMQKKKAANTYS